MDLVRGASYRIIFWNFLLRNRLGNQNFVVHRSRNEDNLLHIKTKIQWVEESFFWNCKPSNARRSLLCFQVLRFTDNGQNSIWNFATWCLFLVCRLDLIRFLMHSQRKRLNSCGKHWWNWLLHLWEKIGTLRE